MPLERNRCFTGRETVLTQLRQALEQEGRAGVSQVQAIAGLGCVGKTQTALEYAHRYFYDVPETERYQAVFWVRVDTEQALQSGYQRIADKLKLREAGAKEPEVVVLAVQRWFGEHSGWLLVLDNADQPDFVADYLPRQGQGHVLITSRRQDLQQLGVVQPLSLNTLDPGEAVAFLLRRTGRDSGAVELQAVEELAAELGYLPLALEQAAAYMVTTGAGFGDYLGSYRGRRLELLDRAGPMLGEYRDPIATTWNINFQAVEEASIAAADLLRLSAFLHPDSIPYDLIVSGVELLGEPIQEALADIEDNPLAFVELLEPLRRYSLVRSEVEQTYSVHRLVQEVLKIWLDEETEKLGS
ncbi:MAG: NB-ARC domain-containing protein [Cyanobacteria bacterium P01_H01_bin.130]